MIISFDLWGIFWLIIIPPIVLFLCRLSWNFSDSTGIIIDNIYIKNIIKENNDLCKENIRLQEQIAKMYSKEE